MTLVIDGMCEARAARTLQLAVRPGTALVVAVDNALRAFTCLQEPTGAHRVDPDGPLMGVHDSGGDESGPLVRVLIALQQLHIGDAAPRALELEAEVSAADRPHAQPLVLSLIHISEPTRLLSI